MTYTAYSPAGPLVALATTEDFRTFERQGSIMSAEDKDAAFFPRRFAGRWALIHRPVPHIGGAKANMWLSFSPDLRNWGDHTVLLEARDGAWWDAGKIGLSTPPIETDDGWLVIYHGVRSTPAGALYRVGLRCWTWRIRGKCFAGETNGSLARLDWLRLQPAPAAAYG